MVKYTVEKILHLANQDKPLNVSVSERSCTDLATRVDTLISGGFIYLEAQDDSDKYYRITTKGKIKLLKLQIEWRKLNSKPTDKHELELEILTEATK